MNSAPAPWVFEAAQSPIAFAQVREDATLDLWVAGQLNEQSEVLMVASGGCTAAALAASSKFARLHLVDPNPAQIALSRLKLRLLETAEPEERLALLGHALLAAADRQRHLAVELKTLDLAPDILGPLDAVAKAGPDHAGRYEILFANLREALRSVSDELTALLQLHSPAEQSQRADPNTKFGRALDAAFDSVMALPNLVGLFGEGATRNRCEPFSRHFAHQTRHVLATLPAAENPYLWQMLLGRFPEDVAYPWLMAGSPARMPGVRWNVAAMAEVLDGQIEAFDFIHLSNSLDWIAPEEAQFLLKRAWEALRPGGWIFIRQLNSNLDLPSMGRNLNWQDEAAEALHRRDRSFFYRKLHLAKKP